MLRIELLSREHDREGFSCSERDLDDYLKRTARQHNEKGISRTFVLVDSDEPVKILGFFTLASCEVVAAELPQEYAKKYPRKAPAAKLARLAVARDHWLFRGREEPERPRVLRAVWLRRPARPSARPLFAAGHAGCGGGGAW